MLGKFWNYYNIFPIRKENEKNGGKKRRGPFVIR
jgi:hypothetical protein